MADERVSITIDIDVKDLKNILLTTSALKGLDTAANKTSNRINKLTGAISAQNISMVRGSKGSTMFTRQLTLLEKVGGKVIKRARMVMFATIAMVAEFAVAALTLASVNALFVAGQVVMKAYNVGMQALAGTVAAFGAAAIAAAAAFQEFQAAQYQYRYKDSKEVGTALDQSSFALRSLYKDATLASFGMTGLSGAFAAVSKQSAFTPATKAALKAMADFAAASGDPQKSLAAAANFVGLMQKNAKFSQETLAAASQISPEFEKAFKKGGYSSVKKFMTDLTSGKLATDAGVAGQADAVNKTLFAQFKGMISQGFVELSDVGIRILEPVKKAMHDIFQGLLRTFRRVSGDLVGFGKGPLLNSLVAFTYRIEEFTVMLFRKFLPATEGFWKRTTRIFTGLKVYFYEVRDALDKLRDGGSVVIKTFGKPLVDIFKQIGQSAKNVGDLAKNNRENWEKFSAAISRFVEGFFDLSRGFKTAFDAALPIISLMVKFVGQLMSLVGQLLGGAGKLGGIFGNIAGAAATIGIGFTAMKGRRAARYGTNKMLGYTQSGGQVPMSEEELIYSGIDTGNLAAMEQSPFSALNRSPISRVVSGNMATGETAADTAASGSMTTSDLAEKFGDLDKIGKAISPIGKGKGKGGVAQALSGVADAMTANTVTVNANVVNVNRSGKGAGATPAGQNVAPTVGRDPKTGRFVKLQQDITQIPSTGELGADIFPQPKVPGGGPLNRRQKLKNFFKNNFGNTSSPPVMNPLTGEMRTTGASRGQNIKNYFKNTKTAQQINSVKNFKGGGFLKNAGRTFLLGSAGLSQSLDAGTAPLDGTGVTGAMPGGGGPGGVGGNPKGFFARGGLKGAAGRFAFGPQYAPGNNIGFKNRFQQFAGMGKESKFVTSYNNAKNAAMASGKGFGKIKGLKAGVKGSLSGMGMIGAMAASQGISFLQNKGIVSDEAAPGMQLGASIGAINPMLGLAVGAGMTALSSKTRKGGTLAGAASGAALGSMIAPGIGTIIGGAIGAGVGFVMAGRNQAKMAKQAAKAVGDKGLFAIASAAVKGISSGTSKLAREQVSKFQKLSGDFGKATTKEERAALLNPYKDMLGKNEFDLMTGKNSTDAAEQFEKTAKDMGRVTTPMFNQFDDVMKSLRLSTGLSSDAIFELAMEKNVNLYDSTLKLSDITEKLGKGMVRTADQFSAAIRDVSIAASSVFADFKAEKGMKDALQGAFETLAGGDNSTDAFADFAAKRLDFQNTVSPNSPVMNMINSLQGFGIGENTGKGTFFQPGGILSGTTMNKDTTTQFAEFGNKQITGASFEMASQLGSMITGAGAQFSDADQGRKGLENLIAGLMKSAAGGDETALAKLNTLENDLLRGTALTGKTPAQVQEYITKNFGPNAMASFGSGNKLQEEASGKYDDAFVDALTEEQAILRNEFLNAIQTGFFDKQGTPQWWNQMPNWWAEGLKIEGGKIVPADTSSPRGGRVGDTSVSKTLNRTMSRHSQFDGMLTGKRKITSAWRDTNLGSPSSDHVTGKAYDLTGQNLGQYSSLIKAAGGFAEFHGAAGTRHLHVVPPAGPMGDSSMAKVAAVTNGTSYGPDSGDNITINVYESVNAKVTAQEVANKIAEMQRNYRQRS